MDLSLVNFPESFNTRFILTLEQDINGLFESNAKVDNGHKPEAKIIIYEAPYISYPQIKLDKNFEVYFNSTLRAKNVLRTGTRMMPYHQSFEINTGTQSINVNFVDTNRQCSFLEVSLVYNKSDQHKIIYDSYNVKINKNPAT